MDAVVGAERQRLPERLQRREEERQLEAGKKRQERESQAVLEEKSSYFRASFDLERAAIDELLGREPGPGEQEEVEEVSGRLQRLQKLLNDSVMFLPSYDVRQAQEQLGRLQAALELRRQQLRPRKKFAFKSRKKEAAPPGPSASATAAPPATLPAKATQPPASPQCGLHGLSGQLLFMEAEEIRQKDVQLTQLRDCTVTLTGSPATLHLRGLSGCRVLCGPVSSSVFVDDCSGCLISVPCQQLRVHRTRDSRLYLHVTSRAIIEDCGGLLFAPYSWSYPGILRDYELAGLDRATNNWDQVDDFNWLAAGARSPNWGVIPEEERITHWN